MAHFNLTGVNEPNCLNRKKYRIQTNELTNNQYIYTNKYQLIKFYNKTKLYFRKIIKTLNLT